MKSRLLTFLLTLTSLSTLFAQADVEIARLLRAYEAHGRLSGTVLVQRSDSVLLAEAYGCADFAANAPTQLNSVFGIASLSKQFTAAAILHLVQEGSIDLQVPINAYLGNYQSDRWKKVTVHHLLSHTSGIPSLMQFGHGLDDVFPEETPIALSDLIDHFKGLKLMSKPGKKYSYNNSGYVLLAAIIETMSGMPYGEYMGQLFERYGLSQTSHGASNSDLMAWPHYGYNQQQHKRAPVFHPSWLIGAGSIYSTVEDLALWNQIIHGEDFLTPELREAYFRKHEQTWGSNYYAYGWERLEIDGYEYIHHDGTIMGYTCDLVYEPRTKTLSILLTNQTHEPLHLMGQSEDFVRQTNRDIMEILHGKTATSLPPLRATPDQQPQTSYTFGNNYQLELVEQNDQWQIRAAAISPLSFSYENPIDLNTPLRERAARAVMGLTAKKFRRFAKECDGTMKTLTYFGVVRLGMNSIMKGMGEWQRSVLFDETDGVVRFRMFCENGSVDFSLHFNEEGKIQGIFDTGRTDKTSEQLPLRLPAQPVAGGFFIDGFSYGEEDMYLLWQDDEKVLLKQGSRSFIGE